MRSTLSGTVSSFDGSPVSYRDHGGDGPVLMMLPGWGCVQTLWDASLLHLSRFRCVTLDYAGFGSSGEPRTRQWAVENLARDVRAVLIHLNLADAILVGHSLGGAVALEAAYLCPDRVRAVIGVDTYTYPGFYDRLDERLLDEFMAPFRADYAAEIRRFVPAFLHGATDPALNALAIETMAGAPAERALAVLEQVLRWDLAESLLRCPVPVAAINAAALLADERRNKYAARIDINTLDAVGHFLMLDRPEAFAAAVAAIALRPA